MHSGVTGAGAGVASEKSPAAGGGAAGGGARAGAAGDGAGGALVPCAHATLATLETTHATPNVHPNRLHMARIKVKDGGRVKREGTYVWSSSWTARSVASPRLTNTRSETRPLVSARGK